MDRLAARSELVPLGPLRLANEVIDLRERIGELASELRSEARRRCSAPQNTAGGHDFGVGDAWVGPYGGRWYLLKCAACGTTRLASVVALASSVRPPS